MRQKRQRLEGYIYTHKGTVKGILFIVQAINMRQKRQILEGYIYKGVI